MLDVAGQSTSSSLLVSALILVRILTRRYSKPLWLAQWLELQTQNLVVAGSTPVPLAGKGENLFHQPFAQRYKRAVPHGNPLVSEIAVLRFRGRCLGIDPASAAVATSHFLRPLSSLVSVKFHCLHSSGLRSMMP